MARKAMICVTFLALFVSATMGQDWGGMFDRVGDLMNQAGANFGTGAQDAINQAQDLANQAGANFVAGAQDAINHAQDLANQAQDLAKQAADNLNSGGQGSLLQQAEDLNNQAGHSLQKSEDELKAAEGQINQAGQDVNSLNSLGATWQTMLQNGHWDADKIGRLITDPDFQNKLSQLDTSDPNYARNVEMLVNSEIGSSGAIAASLSLLFATLVAQWMLA